MEGTIIVSEGAGVRVHSYVSPVDAWHVNTHIVEGPTQLIVFDAQLLSAHAEEVASYLEGLHKPIERIVVSHAHPDHWAGLDLLTQRFPSAPRYALPGVNALSAARGPTALAGLSRVYGAKVPSRAVVPDRELQLGTHRIDGVELQLSAVADAESELQLVALLPAQRLLLAFDLVFNANDHLFTVVPFFDHWISVLRGLQNTDGYDRILVGHGAPTERAAIAATIDYLEQAARLHAAAPDASAYASALIAAFPQRQHPEWVAFSARLLFANTRRNA